MTEPTELFMRDTDAFSWYLEHDPGLRSTIVAVAWLDSRPDFERLAARLERAVGLVPRFRQCPVQPPARMATPKWVDTAVDLTLHLRRIGSPPPHSPATVVDFARIEAMTGFDLTRPLWRFTLIEGLEGDRAALVMKVHHSLTDGIGGSRLAFLLFEATAGEEGSVPAPPTEAGRPPPAAVGLVQESLRFDARRMAGALRAVAVGALPFLTTSARHPWRTTCDAMATAGSVRRFVQPVSETLSPVMTERGLGRWLGMLELDVGDLKRAGQEAGGTLNDAFMASLTGGFRRYHLRHAAPVEELRVMMPVSLRREGDPAASNRITLSRFTLPVGVEDPATRVRLTGQRCRKARRERALPLSDGIAGVLNLLPSVVVGSMLKHVDYVASNVPGVPVPISLAGAGVSGYYGFGPTTGSSVNVTLFTYCGACCVGVTVDTAAVPDHGVLMECLGDGFEEVLGLAGAHRPVRLRSGLTTVAGDRGTERPGASTARTAQAVAERCPPT